MEKVNLADKFSLFNERWSPKIVGSVDDYDIKLVKLEGEFVWHKHDAEDELFFVVNGQLTMDFRDRTLDLEQGEFLIVPKGVEHRPRADRECQVMLLYQGALIMTHLMARGGRVPLTARGVAARLWRAAPPRAPRLTSGQGKPVK